MEQSEDRQKNEQRQQGYGAQSADGIRRTETSEAAEATYPGHRASLEGTIHARCSSTEAASTSPGHKAHWYAPDWTFVPPEKWPPDPPDEPVPVPVTPPEPIDNYEAIVAYWAWRGVPDFVPDTRCFFLVRGQQNVAYATNCEQLCVGMETWRKEYRDLDGFQSAERIWVILDPREDNRAFLQSLAADIWIRERCMIVRWEVPSICKYRLLWERAHRSPLPSGLIWLQAAWSDFEKVHKFIPISAPNCTEQLEALLAKPREPEQPARFDGGYLMPGYYPDPR